MPYPCNFYTSFLCFNSLFDVACALHCTTRIVYVLLSTIAEQDSRAIFFYLYAKFVSGLTRIKGYLFLISGSAADRFQLGEPLIKTREALPVDSHASHHQSEPHKAMQKCMRRLAFDMTGRIAEDQNRLVPKTPFSIANESWLQHRYYEFLVFFSAEGHSGKVGQSYFLLLNFKKIRVDLRPCI